MYLVAASGADGRDPSLMGIALGTIGHTVAAADRLAVRGTFSGYRHARRREIAAAWVTTVRLAELIRIAREWLAQSTRAGTVTWTGARQRDTGQVRQAPAFVVDPIATTDSFCRFRVGTVERDIGANPSAPGSHTSVGSLRTDPPRRRVPCRRRRLRPAPRWTSWKASL